MMDKILGFTSSEALKTNIYCNWPSNYILSVNWHGLSGIFNQLCQRMYVPKIHISIQISSL
jgi:hypothetical protein